MPNEDEAATVTAIKEQTKAFLNLGWVGAMYSYAHTIGVLTPPPTPADQPGMIAVNRHGVPVLSVPDLMKRAKRNAARWEPLLGEMLDVARPIKEYATLSMVTVEELSRQSKEKLAPAAWAKLSPDARQAVRDEFQEVVDGLKEAAERNHQHAISMRDKALGYRVDILADHDESADVQGKYKDWLAGEEVTMEAWEEAHKLQKGDVDQLITKLQEDVRSFNKKWAGMTSGAVGSSFGMVVLPPFGTLVFLIAMSVMAAQAAEFKRQMDDFQSRVERVQRYNEVKVFFKTMDSMFQLMLEVMDGAADALGKIAGMWTNIAADLKSVTGPTIGLDGLPGAQAWESPIKLLKKLGVVAAYENLIKDCTAFVNSAYVSEIKTIKAGLRA